jgi:tetratricopeptide (TPR) repeat protein
LAACGAVSLRRWVNATCCLSTIVVCGAADRQTSAHTSTDQCSRGATAAEQIAACRVLAAAYPRQSAAQHNLGRAFALAGYADSAAAAFERAIALDHANAGAYVALAQAMNTLGRSEDAIDAALNAARYRNADIDVYSALGFAYARLGRFDAALLELDEAVRLDSTDVDLLGQRGVVLHALGRYSEALVTFANTARQAPHDVRAFGGIANSAAALGRPALAIAAWQEAARRDAQYFAHRPEEAAMRDRIVRASTDAPDTIGLRRLVAASTQSYDTSPR